MLEAILAAAPAPNPAALARAWFAMVALAAAGVVALTTLALLFSWHRHRRGSERRARAVTSRLSAWEEAGARAAPPDDEP